MYPRIVVLVILFVSAEADPQSQLRWSRDETNVVFDGYYGVDQKYAVFLMGEDGAGIRYLTDGYDPTWTPDGKVIFKGPEGVYTINPDGSSRVLLARDAISASPDGERLLFLKSTGSNSYVLESTNLDGSEVANLTFFQDTDRIAGGFMWSPDHSKVLYSVAHRQGITTPIHLAVAPGYTIPSGGENYCWAPDGRSLAYDKSDVGGESAIYAIDLTTKKETLLINNARFPQWSPDGKRMAFISGTTQDGTWDIYVQNLGGTERIRLTENPDQEGILSWSPGGTRVTFRTGDSAQRVHIIEVDGRHSITAIEGLSWGQIKSQFHK